MFPFLAPITMMVRIMTETPPFWQIIAFAWDWIRHRRRTDLVGVADLSRRDVDVREESNHSGSLALDTAGVIAAKSKEEGRGKQGHG